MNQDMAIRVLGTAMLLGAGCSVPTEAAPGGTPSLELHLRSRTASGGVGRDVRWEPRKTAFIVCDMWDDHWCKGAAARVAELAGPMNLLLKKARSRGVFILHAPSTTTGFYQGTPARRRAQEAPPSVPPAPLSKEMRWGTAWCWPDASREGELPIDDSDMGCDCDTPCAIREAWSRQIATIEIDQERDALTDDGQETVNLLAARGIEHVALLGVHLNMCVLGRPFAIRQMVHQGRDVALIRDMTDTMYNHRKRPGVTHFAGTDLVIDHVERFWCPSFTSADLLGGSPFRFRADSRP